MAVFSLEREPVALNQVDITVKSSGRKINVCDGGYGCGREGLAGSQEFGSYTIFHDGLRDKIPGNEMNILVQGQNKELAFRQDFKIGENGCHVFKAAGPDTVFVEVE